MGHTVDDILSDMPPPNPWLMAVATIGAGATLWRLTPDIVRRKEESRRAGWGDRPSGQRWPNAVRAYHLIAGRAACILIVLGGLVLLGIQIARA